MTSPFADAYRKNCSPTNMAFERVMTQKALRFLPGSQPFFANLGLSRMAWRGEEMSAYRLDPVPTGRNDPRWEKSHIKELVWAGAGTPEKARELVAQKTMTFA